MQRSTSRMRRAARVSVKSVAAATLIVACACALRGEPQSQSTRDARRGEMETRQRDLWNLERAKRKPSERKRDERPAYRQVSEDFEKLQLSSYNLSGAANSATALDYEQIQEEAAEIRKRAARLMSTLMLPDSEKGQKPKKGDEAPAATADLRANIAALDELVKSFVWNPIFQQSGIVDVENSTKARRDLDGIIRLSEQIRKSAEAASKSAGGN